jgi:hypothetical protein
MLDKRISNDQAEKLKKLAPQPSASYGKGTEFLNHSHETTSEVASKRQKLLLLSV